MLGAQKVSHHPYEGWSVFVGRLLARWLLFILCVPFKCVFYLLVCRCYAVAAWGWSCGTRSKRLWFPFPQLSITLSTTHKEDLGYILQQ